MVIERDNALGLLKSNETEKEDLLVQISNLEVYSASFLCTPFY